jgi:hypothetical protein
MCFCFCLTCSVEWQVHWYISKEWEGNGHGLIWSYVSEFAWRDWGNPWNTTVRMVVVQVIRNVSGTRSSSYRSRRRVQWKIYKNNINIYNSVLICLRSATAQRPVRKWAQVDNSRDNAFKMLELRFSDWDYDCCLSGCGVMTGKKFIDVSEERT